MMRLAGRLGALVCAMGLLALVAGCGTASDSGSSSSGKGDGKSAKVDSCGTKATDDCTPHVGPNGSVRVDALIWRVKGVRVADSLGDQEYGLGEKADGKFVIVTLKVHSDKNESVTLADNAFQLAVGGNTYDADSDGTIAAIGSGEKPLFFEDIGPDSTVTGKVVFDVPPRVLKKKLEMRFNELGLGSTHGFIRLPTLG